jgi:hypothetical protein
LDEVLLNSLSQRIPCKIFPVDPLRSWIRNCWVEIFRIDDNLFFGVVLNKESLFLYLLDLPDDKPYFSLISWGVICGGMKTFSLRISGTVFMVSLLSFWNGNFFNGKGLSGNPVGSRLRSLNRQVSLAIDHSWRNSRILIRKQQDLYCELVPLFLLMLWKLLSEILLGLRNK